MAGRAWLSELAEGPNWAWLNVPAPGNARLVLRAGFTMEWLHVGCMVPGGILVGSVVLMVCTAVAVLRGPKLPSRPYMHVRLWSASLFVFAFALFVGYVIDTADVHNWWIVPLAAMALITNPLFTYLLLKQSMPTPRWLMPAMVCLVVGAALTFFLAPPRSWFGVVGMATLLVSPYAIAMVIMPNDGRAKYGVPAMRSLYGSLSGLGFIAMGLSATFWYSGVAPNLGRLGIEVSMLVLAYGFSYSVFAPTRMQQAWSAEAVHRLQQDLQARIKGGTYSPRDLPSMVADFIEQGQPFVVHGAAPDAPCRVFGTWNGLGHPNGEIHLADIEVPGKVLAIVYAREQIFPDEQLETLRGLASAIRLAHRDETARKVLATDLRQAQKLEKVKSDFLRSIGHELGNPLTPMALQLAVMRRRCAPSVGEHLDVLDRNLKRLKSVIGNLNDVSKLQDAAMMVCAVPVEVRSLADDVVQGMRPMARAKGLDVTLDAPHEVWVQGDQGRLMQVIGNMVSNAIKYSDSGTIQVCVAAGDEARVSVQDCGRGLDESQIADIGRPYARFHTDEEIEGTGLGVYVTRGIMEAHGGRLDVTSQGPGHGSTFSAVMPLAPTGVPREGKVPAIRRES